jgi:AraC family transcriptional regulator, ethanolamine operon transcriptional activator
MSISIEGPATAPHLVEGHFDDIDAMATSPLAWNMNRSVAAASKDV